MKVFAATGRHLDERAGPGVGKRIAPGFRNRFELHVPEAALFQFRHPTEHPSQLLRFQALEPEQLFGTVKREDLTAPRIRIEPFVNWVTSPVDS